MKTSKTNIKVPYPELRGNLSSVKYPALAEVKYDGEYTAIHWKRGSRAFTVNKNGKVREDFTVLNKITELLEASEADSCTLMAELYYGKGESGQLYDLLSNKESDDLGLAVFDCIGLNGIHIGKEALIDRREVLFDLIGNDFCPEGRIVHCFLDVDDFFKGMVDIGFEGIVVKSLDSTITMGPCNWAKYKFKDQTDYVVHSIDSGKERIEVSVPNPNSTTAVGTVYVGVKAPNKYKKHISVGDMVTIEHQGVLPSGSLRHPVLIPKKEWK